MYRVSKSFEVESGHFLSKHQEKCKNPHGHTRRIEIVVASESLDANDMVCDFKVFKLAVGEYLDSLDHAMLISSESPHLEYFRRAFERVIPVEGSDPTTEAMSRLIYLKVRDEIALKKTYTAPSGAHYRFPDSLRLEKVRVWETSTTWAEYSE